MTAAKVVTFFGIASRITGDVYGWRMTREEAEADISVVLGEAPEYEGALYVAALEWRASLN
jgi:hypothetical protein